MSGPAFVCTPGLQAATNCLLSHVVALMYVNGMLGAVNKPPPKPLTVIEEGVPQASQA